MKPVIAAFLTISTFAVAVSLHAANPIRLLISSNYPKKEVRDAAGQWWGICGDKTAKLMQLTVKVEPVPSQPDLSSVRSDCDGYSPFWIRGDQSWLEDRQVVTGKVEVSLPKASITGDFNGHPLTIKEVVEKNEGLYSFKRLVLNYRDRSQTIYSGVFGYFETRWVGDIDGDGKPDLFLRTTDSDHKATNRLFISSSAKIGELVVQAATLSQRME